MTTFPERLPSQADFANAQGYDSIDDARADYAEILEQRRIGVAEALGVTLDELHSMGDEEIIQRMDAIEQQEPYQYL